MTTSGRRRTLAAILLAFGAWGGASAAGELPSGPSPDPSPPPSAATRTADLKIDRWTWGKDVDGDAPIRAVVVRNDFGDIRARATDDRRLEAWGVIQRLDPGPEGVGVTVERRGNVVALTVGYPPGRVRDADPDPPKDSYDRLDLVVFVPEGVALAAHSVRGMVEARGLKGDVAAVTLDGRIAVGTTGGVHARTVSGEVTAAFGAGSGAAPVVLESVSGTLRVTVPADAGLDLRAETGGTVASELKLSERTRAGRTIGTATVGDGGRMLLLSSATGNVEILRAE